MFKSFVRGHLGRDPELKRIPSGESVLEFSVGASTGYGDRKGTEWVRVSVWGKRGEALAKMLKKGSHVLVDGDLTTNPWLREGKAEAGMQLRANGVELLDKKPSDDMSAAPAVATPETAQWAAPKAAPREADGYGYGEDEIPF